MLYELKRGLLHHLLRFTIGSFYFQLKLLSTTRWVERHTALSDILAMYPYIKAALTRLSEPDHDTKTITEATGLLSCMSKPQFIVAFVISEHMLGYTKQLSIKLQGKQLGVQVGFNFLLLKSTFLG